MKTDKQPCNETPNSYRKIASYLSAASATMIQTTGTHVLDTISKRLQKHKNVHFSLSEAKVFFNNIYSIAYPTKTSSIWDGYKAALTYRVTACTLTLGSQPLTQAFLTKKYGNNISYWTGEKYKSTATHMLSGALYGVVEVAFLPLDRWKLLRQMNNKVPFFDLIKQQKNNLYVGSSITALRNIKAFSAWFGVSDVANKSFSHNGSVPFYQRVITSYAGAVVATIVSNPADVVKTIKQTQSDRLHGQKPDSAIKIAAKIYEQNGVYGFARGVWPRLGSIVPRLTFLKVLSEELVPVINKALDCSVSGPRK